LLYHAEQFINMEQERLQWHTYFRDIDDVGEPCGDGQGLVSLVPIPLVVLEKVVLDMGDT